MRPVSLVWLGWYFAKRLLVRAFLPGRLFAHQGLPRFLASYGPEGPYPLEVQDKNVVAALSHCTACGACDARFDAYHRIARTTLRAPSELVLAASRSLPDWDALAAPLAELERGDLGALELVCPAGIPFREVVLVAKARVSAKQAARERAPALPRSTIKHDPG